MSWLDNIDFLKEKLKQKFYSLTQSLQVKTDIDKAIDKLPIDTLESDFYYDFVKDELVPKALVGTEISNQTNQLISLLEKYESNRQKGTTYEIEIPAGKEFTSNLPDFSEFMNTLKIEVYFPNDTGFQDIKLDFYLYGTENDSSKPSQLLNEYFYKDYVYRAERIYHFIPSKIFQINLLNNGSKTIFVKCTFSFSENIQDDVHQYDLVLNNDTKTFNIYNHSFIFNKVAIILHDASILNVDINISVGVDTFAQTVEIHDETVSTGTTHQDTYVIPASSNVFITVKNNQSSVLTGSILLFFSNENEDGIITHELNGAYHLTTTSLDWSKVNKTGSNLTDLDTRNHSDLQNVSANQHHNEAHTLASHSSKAHSELTGVSANQHHNQLHGSSDHTDTYLQEIKEDTTPELGGNLDVNNYDINTINLLEFFNSGAIKIQINKSTGHGTLTLVNLNATYKLNLDVEGNITLGGTVDGVDIYGHASNEDAHHNKNHDNTEHITNYVSESTFNSHKTRHQNSGADEINVAGLSGVLADEQDAGKIKGITVDDTDLANGKILKYNSTSGNLEYEDDDSGGGAGISYQRVENSYSLTRDSSWHNLDVSSDIVGGHTVVMAYFMIRTADTVTGQDVLIVRYGGTMMTVYAVHNLANGYMSIPFGIEIPSNYISYKMGSGLSSATLYFLGYTYT